MKKTKLHILTVCDYAIISRENKVSILGMFDHVFVQSLPASHSKMFVVGVLEGEPSTTVKVSLSLVDPKDNDIFPRQELAIAFGPNGKANLIAELSNVQFNETGTFNVILDVDDEELGRQELIVMHAKPEAAPAKTTQHKKVN